MGENSSKSLRGAGMNDIIFNGSATKASKNIAAVYFLENNSKIFHLLVKNMLNQEL